MPENQKALLRLPEKEQVFLYRRPEAQLTQVWGSALEKIVVSLKSKPLTEPQVSRSEGEGWENSAHSETEGLRALGGSSYLRNKIPTAARAGEGLPSRFTQSQTAAASVIRWLGLGPVPPNPRDSVA